MVIGCCVAFGCAALGLGLFAMFVWRTENRELLIVTPCLLFCLNEVVRVWPAAIYAVFTDISGNLYVTSVMISSTAAFALGYVMVRAPMGWSGSAGTFWRKTLQVNPRASGAGAVALCSLAFCGAGFYFFQGIPPAAQAVLGAASGDVDDVASLVSGERLRLTKGHYFGGEYRGQGIMRSIMGLGWPLVTSVSILAYARLRTRKWLICAIGTCLGCFIFVAGDGTRGNLLWAAISVISVISLHFRFRLRTCLGVVGVLMVIFFSLSATKKLAGTDSVQEKFEQLANRVFVGNGINTVYVIEFIQCGQIETRYGAIQANEAINALPFVQGGEPFSYELFLLVETDAKSSATTFASMTYLGTLYADFGWGGCILGYWLCGTITAGLTRFLYDRPKTPLSSAFVGMAAIQLGCITLNGPLATAIDLGMIGFLQILYLGCARFSPAQAVV